MSDYDQLIKRADVGDERADGAVVSNELPSPVASALPLAGLSRPVRRTFAVGAVDDPHEHEADRVAGSVVEALRARHGSGAPAAAAIGSGSAGPTARPDGPRGVPVLRRLVDGPAKGDADRGADTKGSAKKPLPQSYEAGGKALNQVDPSRFGQTQGLTQLRVPLRATQSAADAKHAKSQKTTLFRLLTTLDQLFLVKHPPSQKPLIERIVKLSEGYLKGHRTSKKSADRTRSSIVEDVLALAQTQLIKYEGDQMYVDAMESTLADTPGEKQRRAKEAAASGQDASIADDGKEADEPEENEEEDEERSRDARGGKKFDYHIQTDEAMEYKEYLSGVDGSSAGGAFRKAFDVVSGAGLTMGEIVAIKTYTGHNYTYMNPAITNYQGGLDKGLIDADKMAKSKAKGKGANGPDADTDADDAYQPTPEDRKAIQLEGAGHAGVAMNGLRKLPAYSGTTYRGENMNLARMQQLFPRTGVVTNSMLLSTSRAVSTAMQFYNQGNGPIKLFVELQVTDAKDVSKFSQVPHELEALLLPNAKYKVIDIQTYDPQTGARGPLTGPPTGKGGEQFYVTVQQV